MRKNLLGAEQSIYSKLYFVLAIMFLVPESEIQALALDQESQPLPSRPREQQGVHLSTLWGYLRNAPFQGGRGTRANVSKFENSTLVYKD